MLLIDECSFAFIFQQKRSDFAYSLSFDANKRKTKCCVDRVLCTPCRDNQKYLFQKRPAAVYSADRSIRFSVLSIRLICNLSLGQRLSSDDLIDHFRWSREAHNSIDHQERLEYRFDDVMSCSPVSKYPEQMKSDIDQRSLLQRIIQITINFESPIDIVSLMNFVSLVSLSTIRWRNEASLPLIGCVTKTSMSELALAPRNRRNQFFERFCSRRE